MAIEHLLHGIKQFHSDACEHHEYGDDPQALTKIRKLRNSLMEADLGDTPPHWRPKQPLADAPVPLHKQIKYLAQHAANRSQKALTFANQGDTEHAGTELSFLVADLADALVCSGPPVPSAAQQPLERIPTDPDPKPGHLGDGDLSDGQAREPR